MTQEDDLLDQLAMVVSWDESVGFPGPIVADHWVEQHGNNHSESQLQPEWNLIPAFDMS